MIFWFKSDESVKFDEYYTTDNHINMLERMYLHLYDLMVLHRRSEFKNLPNMIDGGFEI